MPAPHRIQASRILPPIDWTPAEMTIRPSSSPLPGLSPRAKSYWGVADDEMADDDMNVFCFGGKVFGSALALELIETRVRSGRIAGDTNLSGG